MARDSWIEPAQPDRYGPGPVLEALGDDEAQLVLETARKVVFDQHGAEFFDGIAHFLYSMAGAELVVVGRIAPGDGDQIQTISRYFGGERTPNKIYALADTPCGSVMGPQSLCVYPSHVAELFPQDTGLAEMGAQGYLGMPLFDHDGTKIGIMALITVEPIDDLETLSAVLKLVGARASIELEYALAVREASANATELANLLKAHDRLLRKALE